MTTTRGSDRVHDDDSQQQPSSPATPDQPDQSEQPEQPEQPFAAAAALLADGQFEASVAAFRRLADTWPARRADALVQAGSALVALGRYADAARSYAAARDAGADAATMDEHIWAACQGLEIEAMRLYETLCPDGRHALESVPLTTGTHQAGGKGAPIFDAVAEGLTRFGLRFSQVAGEPRFMLAISGDNAHYVCHLRVDEERCFVLFYTLCPLVVPEDARTRMAEFVARANYGLPIGNFEIDVRDGEVRFKTSIDVEDARVTEALLRPVVYANTHTMDRYMPGIVDVLYRGGDPAAVVEAIDLSVDDD
jgi:hypothetical protein